MTYEDDTFFPELTGDEQQEADAWLRDYLRLVIRISDEQERRDELSTPTPLTDNVVLTGSVRSSESNAHEP
jgi:hypothetical protein